MLSVEDRLEPDSHPLALTADAVATNGVNPWNWRDTSTNGTNPNPNTLKVIIIIWIFMAEELDWLEILLLDCVLMNLIQLPLDNIYFDCMNFLFC